MTALLFWTFLLPRISQGVAKSSRGQGQGHRELSEDKDFFIKRLEDFQGLQGKINRGPRTLNDQGPS